MDQREEINPRGALPALMLVIKGSQQGKIVIN